MKKKKRMKRIIEEQDKTIKSLKGTVDGLQQRLRLWREDQAKFEYNERFLQSTEKMAIKFYEGMLFGDKCSVLEGLNKAVSATAGTSYGGIHDAARGSAPNSKMAWSEQSDPEKFGATIKEADPETGLIDWSKVK